MPERSRPSADDPETGSEPKPARATPPRKRAPRAATPAPTTDAAVPPPPPAADPVLVEPPPASPVVPTLAEGADEPPSDQRTPDRFRIVCALVIAGISVVAALTSWRAEVAGSDAAEADQQGSVAAVQAQGDVLRFQSQARAEERLMRRWNEHKQAAAELSARMQDADTAELRAELARRVEVEQRVTERVAFSFPEDYIDQSDKGDLKSLSYDVDGRVTDLLKENRVDTDVQRFFKAADRDQHHRRTLVRLDIILVLALAAATVAQLSRRRIVSLIWLIPGVIAFVAATATFIAVEV